MKKNIVAAILLLAAFAYSCTTKETAFQDIPMSSMSDMALVDDGTIVYEPEVTVPDFIVDDEEGNLDTKTVLTITDGTGGGAKFTFVNGDRLGIFPYYPEAGVQMPFTLKSNDAGHCYFNCPGFSLTSGTTYAAYYPYTSTNTSYSAIPVNFTGQRQTSVDGTSFNISDADYLVAKATPSGGACSFKMSHVAALVVMDVTVPAGTYKEVSLNTSSNLFTLSGTVDLSQSYTAGPNAGITISSPVKSNKVSLTLGSGSGIDLGAGTYRFCMMVAPVDLTGQTVTLRLKDNSNVEHIAYVTGKNLLQGYAYRYSCTVDATTNLVRYNETSNSYIVNINSIDSDGYYFPASQAGNGRAVDWAGIGFNDSDDECYPRNAGGNDGVRFSGNGVEIILNQNSCISDVIFSSNRIYFKASGNRGNAKVTLTNNGTRVWTWHIWCTDEPGTYSVHGYTVMDRNLGAYDEIRYANDMSSGFYYPYGSPFGFTVGEYSNGVEGGTMITMKEYILHPERPYLKDKDGLYMPFNPYYASSPADVWGRIWGNGGAKTCYDPCPPGYKVTPYAFWDGISLTGDYYGAKSGNCVFPFNGRVYRGGIQSLDITLGGRNYSNISTRGYRLYMWSSSSYNVYNAWYYHIRKGDGSGTPPLADGGVNVDILTRGMGVRCVYEW